MPENELVLISNKCSYADFTKQLKEVLSTALLGENNGKLQLSLKDEKINVIMDTLATDHEGSASFSFEDTKKIEDFYSSTQADTLKQSGSFAAIEKDNSNDFYLVLFYNATKDKLIIIYKRLTAVPQNDEPSPVPPSDENEDEETQLELDLNL